MHSKYDEIQEILEDYKKQLMKPEDGLSVKVPARTEWPYQIVRAYNFINQYLFDSRMTVGWLREQCRVNGKSFAAKFEFCTGFGPKQYILQHRIEASKQLLKHSEANITQIALAVGFRSVSAFCNAFKNKENTRPARWRELNQN